MVAATASLPTAPPRKRTLPVGAAHLHVIALVDTTGGAGGSVESYAYTPYGERAVFTASWTPLTATVIDNTVSYTGQRLDAESNLHHFRNRYYSANLGRFITRDPLGYVDGMSLYGEYFAMRFSADALGFQATKPVAHPEAPVTVRELQASFVEAKTIQRMMEVAVAGANAAFAPCKIKLVLDFAVEGSEKPPAEASLAAGTARQQRRRQVIQRPQSSVTMMHDLSLRN